MRFKAHYIPASKDNSAKEYWREFHADTLAEGMAIARRYRRKGFRLHTVTQSDLIY